MAMCAVRQASGLVFYDSDDVAHVAAEILLQISHHFGKARVEDSHDYVSSVGSGLALVQTRCNFRPVRVASQGYKESERPLATSQFQSIGT